MNKKEAKELLNDGYYITHPDIEEPYLYRGETKRLLRGGDNKRIKEEEDFWTTCPLNNWSIHRHIRCIYFQSNRDLRDMDSSRLVTRVKKNGDIILDWYDCLDKISNRITINNSGRNKLKMIQEALNHAKGLFESKIKEKASEEPINFKKWQDGMKANNCFVFNNWYYDCQAHQDYLDERDRVKPIYATSPNKQIRYSSIRKTVNGNPMVTIIEFLGPKLNLHTQTKKYGFKDQQAANDWIMKKIEGKNFKVEES